MSYGYEKTLEGVSYDQALDRVTEALKQEGFGVLTEIDVGETLKKKLDVDFRRYKILGACNPQQAHKALQAELPIGLLLPCNVIVYEDDAGNAVVSIANPREMFRIVDNPTLQSVAEDVDAALRRVHAAL
jgi:uncharacterized protein (DUF302 family)